MSPAHEKPRLLFHDYAPGHGIVVAGESADVGHKYLQALAGEGLEFRIIVAGGIAVTVAIHPYDGLEVPDAFEEGFVSAPVAGVPEFIYGLQELPEPGAEHSVGIGY